MRWKVDLAGDQKTLNVLSSPDETGFRYVELDDGNYLLNEQIFKECTLPDQVRNKASKVLSALNAYAASFTGNRGKIRYVDVRCTEPDGSEILYVKAQSAVAFSAAVLEVVIQDVDGTVRRSVSPGASAPSVHRWMRLIESDENVRKVERLLAEQEHDWVNMYRVLEVIEKDAGGQAELIRLGYTDKKARSLFGLSSNHHESAGDLARHGYSKEPPPKYPMTLHDARSYVHGIRLIWLRQKLGALDEH